jgi:GT2 family glycosyltransferase
MELSIIVLTYNAKDITLKMFPALKKSVSYFEKETGKTAETLVIDNASTDGVLNEIENRFSDFVKIVPNDKNLGFSKGNNLAVKSISKNSRYVLFLNPDVILDEDTIFKTYEFATKQKNFGLVTCNLLLPNNEIDIDCHRSFPTIWNAFCYFTKIEKILGKIFPSIFGRYHMLWENFSQTHEIDACLGAYMLIDRKVGDEVSWWSEDYFLNGEDLDLCYKIKALKGYKIFFYPEAKAYHFKGSSKGTKKVSKNFAKVSDATKNLQINSGIDAMRIFYQKFYASSSPKIINSLVYTGMGLLKKIRLLTKTE